ncbi:type II secretion system F family protein [Paenibacillus sediminis]|uniref:Tight adherence protein B n=1 Tax=Paenibacillus sediminis TaxID=664909 RepID=A0ABS4H5A8_9BACL|nr:type II secretion system F family protein [Paenibacillus sediminis]MBP1937432.1 tight adherence protein B [Paenibacillus sediminis]
MTLQDYTVYKLSIRERTLCIVIGSAIFFAVGYLFYHQWLIAMMLSFAGMLVPRFWNKHMLKQRRSAMSLHFKQALYSLSSSLAAGRSVENSFREAAQDLKMLIPDSDNDLITELHIICTKMEYGQPIEEALQDFSRRAAIEDITNFADVFTACKRTGGDLVEVVRRTSTIIGEKLDIQQELSVMMAQKRFESKALLAAPFLFLIFMNLTAADYMKPMYSGIGMVVSTVGLLMLGVCFWLINKIMNVKI